MMFNAIYILCALASASCALLLIRGYRRSGTDLLFWSALCFVFLAINNVILIFDMILVPNFDFSPYRNIASLMAAGALLYGLIWQEA